MALTLGALGYFVVQRTRSADEAARAAAERATAVIEAENERRLREAEKGFWSAHADAGPEASVSSSAAPGTSALPPKKRQR